MKTPSSLYLVKKSKHVSQHVWNGHIEELSKVIQVQLLSLQLPGSVPILLQKLLCVPGFQPGTAKEGNFMLMNNFATVWTRRKEFKQYNQYSRDTVPPLFSTPPFVSPARSVFVVTANCQIGEGVESHVPPPIYMGLPVASFHLPKRSFTKKPYLRIPSCAGTWPTSGSH